jgi:uncharacterized RDD family membrane protein YckC
MTDQTPPEGPQSPGPGPQSPAPQQPAAQPPAPQPQAYGGQVPPGGWQTAPARPDPFAGQYAGWWPRAGAFIIDALITAIPVILLTVLVMIPILGSLGFHATGDDASAGAFAAISIVGIIAVVLAASLGLFVIRLLYGALLMRRVGSANGQTWGKQLLNIRTVRANGQQFDFGSALLRDGIVQYLLFWVVGSFMLYVPTLLNYLWPLWDDQNRCLHDLMVDSRVIRA